MRGKMFVFEFKQHNIDMRHNVSWCQLLNFVSYIASVGQKSLHACLKISVVWAHLNYVVKFLSIVDV